MVCSYFRKEIPCELLEIYTLVHVKKNFLIEGSFHYVYQARYATSVVVKYLDTVTVKVSKINYKTTLPSDMIFTKEYVSTSDEQV